MCNATFCVKFGIYDKDDYFHVILRLVLHIITHYMHTHVATKSIINNHKTPRYIISEYHAYYFTLHLFDDLCQTIFEKYFETYLNQIYCICKTMHTPRKSIHSILIYSDNRIYDTSDCR